MKILVICGSRRVNSRTRKLTDIAYEYAKQKYKDVTYLDLGKVELESYRGYPNEVQYKKETLEIVKMVETSDVLLIGSPVYDAVFSSAIKNLFEFVNYKILEGKVAGFMVKAASQGTLQLVRSQLVDMMNYFNVVSNPRAVFVSEADFDEKGNLKNEEIGKRISKLVDDTVSLKK